MPSVQSKLAKKARPVHASRPPAPGSRGARKLAERLAQLTPDAASRPAAAAKQARSADGSTAGPALTPQRLAAPVAMPPLDPVRAAESELTKWLALDCEMVGVGPRGSKSALAQVAIVNDRELPVYVCYVKPPEFVTDYRTRFSGVRPFHMKHALPFDQVQKEVRRYLRPCTALHGAGLPLLSRRLALRLGYTLASPQPSPKELNSHSRHPRRSRHRATPATRAPLPPPTRRRWPPCSSTEWWWAMRCTMTSRRSVSRTLEISRGTPRATPLTGKAWATARGRRSSRLSPSSTWDGRSRRGSTAR